MGIRGGCLPLRLTLDARRKRWYDGAASGGMDMKTMRFAVKASDKRNEMHFEVQRKTRAHVFDDRRFKKPKHAKRDMYED